MGSIDFQIASLQAGSAANATGRAYVPPTHAATPVLPPREIPATAQPRTEQDTVSLSGTLPAQQQQNAPSSENAQPPAFALLAQTTTFPPTQNSAAAFNVSASTPAAAIPIAQSTAGTQSPDATAIANASAENGPDAAPAQQTLQQLDRVLQQLGIDPQSLSLISREGMLSWVNDPAALRQIVQDVQAANKSQQDAAAGAANPTHSAAQLSIGGGNQSQNQPKAQNQPEVSAQGANQASASSPAVASTNTNALNQSAATAQQNATAVMQFQKLQDSLAPSGAQDTQTAAISGGSTTAQGQLLNVSA